MKAVGATRVCSRRFVRFYRDQPEPAFFRTLYVGQPQPWRSEKQVPPNPGQLKWQWEPEHIPTKEEYEAFPKVITIFGGSGFLGRYLVQELVENSPAEGIRVATRYPDELAQTFPASWKGKVVAEFVDITDQHNVLAACEGSQGLINMMGISYECELSFYEAHVQSSKWIAHSANTVMASRVIHVSSLASRDNSWSRYSESKFRGEDASLASFPWTTILRFGPLYGKGAPKLQEFLKHMSRRLWYPCVVPKMKIQPTFAGDAAKAIVAALSKPETRELQYDLGGPKVFTHSELVSTLLALHGKSRPVIPVPGVVGDAIASVLQWYPDPLVTRDLIYLIRSHDLENHKLMRSWEHLMPEHPLTPLKEGLKL
eukprot:RCo016340